MPNTPSANKNVSADFTSIADDFRAPDEVSGPYQNQLFRIRQAFSAFDGRLLGIKQIIQTLELTSEEQVLVDNFYEAVTNLHSAILNRSINPNPQSEQPGKDARVTY